jgi:5'-nucleotidase
VKQYLGEPAYKGLIISHHKNLSQGNFLVDDRPKNGAKDFTGEWIHFGTEKYPDWDTVLEYLKQRY